MPWEYSQSTGDLTRNGALIAKGYAGNGNGKNKPSLEHVRNVGPVPKGTYEIHAAKTSSRTGPYVLPLTPVGHNALGRTDFQIHGDSKTNPGNASNGCIILNRAKREQIWQSNDNTLLVIQ